jgi:hypothetical protein
MIPDNRQFDSEFSRLIFRARDLPQAVEIVPTLRAVATTETGRGGQ